MVDTRDIVMNILMDIDTNNTFSNIALTKALRKNQFEEKKDRAFITRLAEGVTERRITLDYIIDKFSKTPAKKCKPFIRNLLRMSVYQLIYMDSIPDSAVVNEAVKLARKHNFGSLSGFVNGILRNISRNKDNIEFPDKSNKVKYYSVMYSIPEWLCEKILSDYETYGDAIIKSMFEDRKTAIRVNTLKLSRDELISFMHDNVKDITVEKGLLDEDALLISDYDFVRKIPGYRQGYFTVQDESSMCAVRAAGIKPGDIVIDVCAAPGGKTTAAAQYLEGEGKVYSRDISEEKLSLIEENVNRLGITNVEIAGCDATVPDEELYETADVVIADLPCSGLGIMGRKNDIKYKLTSEQLGELAELQRKILDTVKSYVKPGGVLLYSTCTINPDENCSNTKHFLDNNRSFSLEAERQFLQGVDGCDGFYYAKLVRDR